MGYSRWLDSAQRGENLLERGTNLSMGEKQILSYARALAADPAIWILDEATANMDSRSEQMMELSFEKASRGKTAILIAHRLATVRSCDLILVLHHGRLVEKGSHAELVRTDGLYSRLYRYQEAAQDFTGTEAR
jgi:ATP-binding cassette subfamily B protein